MASNPIHAAAHLAKILDELKISGSRLGRVIGVPPRRSEDKLGGRRSATADTALRIGQAAGGVSQLMTVGLGAGQRGAPGIRCLLGLYITIGVLVGGRALEIVFGEWPFYAEHLHLLPAWRLGGMTAHGLLLGGALGAALFARRHGKPLLLVADRLVIAAAFLMGMGPGTSSTARSWAQ